MKKMMMGIVVGLLASLSMNSYANVKLLHPNCKLSVQGDISKKQLIILEQKNYQLYTLTENSKDHLLLKGDFSVSQGGVSWVGRSGWCPRYKRVVNQQLVLSSLKSKTNLVVNHYMQCLRKKEIEAARMGYEKMFSELPECVIGAE